MGVERHESRGNAWRDMFFGLLATVVGGVVVAYLIQDARFAPAPTPVPTVAPTPTVRPVVAAGMVRFDEPRGIFSIDYPSIFAGVTDLDEFVIESPFESPVIGYWFGSGQNITGGVVGGMAVVFTSPYDKSLTDEEWQKAIGVDTGGLPLSLENQELLIGVNLIRNHGITIETKVVHEGKEPEYRITFFQELDGALMFGRANLDETAWKEWRERIYLSIEGLVWSPDVVKRVLKAKVTPAP